MSIQAHPVREEPILSERAASYFDRAGQAFMVRGRIRANGTLTLTESNLVFDRGDLAGPLEIPVETIQRLGMGRWHEGLGSFVPVLKITYQGNLVFGVHVADPERWIRALEDLARRRNLPLLEAERRPRLLFRKSRLLLAAFLLLVGICMALPALFSWMHATVLSEQAAVPAAPARSSGIAP